MALSNFSSVTIALLIAFGLIIMYTTLKNSFDSNLPLIFYVIFFGVMRSMDDPVPFWLMGAGFALSMVLRFEFMNTALMRIVKFLELGFLGAMLYFAVNLLWRF